MSITGFQVLNRPDNQPVTASPRIYTNIHKNTHLFTLLKVFFTHQPLSKLSPTNLCDASRRNRRPVVCGKIYSNFKDLLSSLFGLHMQPG